MKKELTKEEAIGLLPDGELVHVFINGVFGLVGADWNREDIIDKINTADRTELTGPMARGTGHGLVIFPPNAKYQSDLLFVETEMEKLEEFDPEGGAE